MIHLVPLMMARVHLRMHLLIIHDLLLLLIVHHSVSVGCRCGHHRLTHHYHLLFIRTLFVLAEYACFYIGLTC